jgi:hypothetical protein
LFIDGLDECTGNDRETIKILRSIIQKSADVKVCVSSRPETVFMDQFNNNPKRRLQDLTSDGINLYVSGILHNDEKMKILYHDEKAEALKLEEEIVSAANGVFLWVGLVLNSLITGLGNLDDIAQLRERLVRVPPEIEELYKHMLKNIDGIYAKDAARIFGIMSIAQHSLKRPIFDSQRYRDLTFRIPGLTALELSLALDKNQDFAINPTPIDKHDLELRMKQLDIKLRKSCAGLLEVSGRGHFRRSQEEVPAAFSMNASATILYHHRTAKDFLDSENLQDLMVKTQQGDRFRPSTALFRARLVIY